MTKRLLIVQFAGDFREAWRLRERTGGETYYGHGYILDELARLAAKHGEAGFLCGTAPPYCEKLPTGATVLGAGADAYKDPRPIIAAIERFDPTHLIVHGPMVKLLRWSLGRDLPLGCLLADSFLMNPLERWWRFAGLSRALATLLTGGYAGSEEIAAALANAGLIRPERESDYKRPARFVVLIGGNRQENSLRPTNVDAPLIAELQKLNATVVMCEPFDAKFSDIAAYRSLNLDISTIDNIDQDMGLCALVYALRGERSHYGIKETSLRLFPTVPTP